MGDYQPYPQCKPSGNLWIGSVPVDWEVTRFKFLLSEPLKYGANESAELNDVDLPRYIRITDIQDNGSLRDETFRSLLEEVAKPYLLNEGDILLARSGATVGKTFIYRRSWGRAAFAGYLIRARTVSKILDANFAYFYLQSSSYLQWLNSVFIQATIQNVSAEKYANLFVPVPDIAQQRIIVRFLDYKTGQIDALIAKKEALLAKLAEKRTALISHAVTKGLDPSVPMKDSGVAWLGEIPAHWSVKRLKFLLSSPLKYGANESAELTEIDFPRYIRITDVNDNGTLRDETFRSLLPEIAQDYLLIDGDILLARSGATVGKSFIYKPSWGSAAYAGYLIRARMNSRMDADFVYLFLKSSCYWQWLNSVFIQSTIQNVSADKYANLIIPVPSKTEQGRIVDYLERALRKIDDQKITVSKAIETLIEYRSALITNAVTGKIDVRNFNVPEPLEIVVT